MQKPSTASSAERSGSSGFSVAEVLVVLVLVAVLTASALALALSSRNVYTTDLNRTTLNQNLRIGIDLVGIDARQAGQGLPEDMPAIQIIDGDSGGPDTLILRRNLLGIVLPVCKDVSAGSAADSVFVAVKKKFPPLGCSPVPDTNGDGWPDNLEAWKNYRQERGGEIFAFIWNPTRQNGEYFVYDDEDRSTFHIHKQNSELWQYDYRVDEGSRIYILEQKTYEVSEDLLQYFLDADTDNPHRLIYGVTNFQAVVNLGDGSSLDTFPGGRSWSEIDSVEILLSGEAEFQGRTLRRTLRSEFFPRNVLSL